MMYEVIMRVEITRRVEADSPEQAEQLVDKGDMMHELMNYRVDPDYIVDEL